MDLSQSKCGVLSETRNLNSGYSSYHLKDDTPIKRTNAQKDLGVIITFDLKWNQHVSMVCAKANKMLGFIKRSSMDIPNEKPRLTLYTTKSVTRAKSVIELYPGLVTTVGITDSPSRYCSTSCHKIQFIPTIHVRNIIQGQTFKN